VSAVRQNDRRRDIRVSTRGSVVVHARRGARGRAVDLSRSGIYLQLAAGEPRCEAGDRVGLELHLDAAGASWLRFAGLVRRSAGSGALSVSFSEVPDDFADVVQAELIAELEIAGLSHVLLVDPMVAQRARRAEALRGAGCYVVEAATPLEVIAQLGGSHARAWTIAIADSVPAAIADELSAFLTATCEGQVLVVTLGAALALALARG
jgi:PilZ domain